MLDLDSFKLANDVFGHAYGDQVIVHVAEALKESFPGDVVCRMGGDEFLVWCEDVDEGALEDRIASALRAMEVERVEDGRTFLFSASAGGLLVRRLISESGFGVVLGQDGRQALLLAILVWDEERSLRAGRVTGAAGSLSAAASARLLARS